MRRFRGLAILASLAIAVGGAGLAKASTSSPSAQNTSGTVKCTVAPSSGTAPLHVSAYDTGSSSSAGTSITGYSVDWGDGTHTAQQASAPSQAHPLTHTYTSAGSFEVNETIYGNFGDGHETDECAGSPVTVNNGTPPPNPCPSGVQPDTKGQCPPSCNSSEDENANNGEEHGKKVGEEQHENDCPQPCTNDCPPPPCTSHCPPPPCSANSSEPGGDSANPNGDDNCHGKPPVCDEAHENDANTCNQQPPECKLSPSHPNGDGDGDADDKIQEVGGTCPNSFEFAGATFYAAENNPMQVVVDASAVNAPSNKTSGNDPIPGDKLINTNCASTPNSCDAVTNRDFDKDITNYLWVFTAYRQHSKSSTTADFVQQIVVGPSSSPSAAAQFTKTQGDDVVQITLTISEKGEGDVTISTPPPTFSVTDGASVNKAPTPTSTGNVILEPCDHGGLITAPETLGDTLGDAAAPLLQDPNANGPLSSAIEQNTVNTPLAGVGNEVACVISALPTGNPSAL